MKLRFNAHYHPQANPTERVNQTLKTMLSMYVSDNHRLWDSKLSQVACALRTARSDTTKCTPYFINFGRNMILNGSEYDQLQYNSCELDENRSLEMNQMFKDVVQKLKLATKQSQNPYNLRRRAQQFDINQLVWRRNYVLSDAAKYYTQKLAPKYIGPFLVKKILSPWTYELVDTDGQSRGV